MYEHGDYMTNLNRFNRMLFGVVIVILGGD